MILVALTGCSSSKVPFDDRNISFKVIDTQTSENEISKSIEVTNQTGYDLINLKMELSYYLKNSSSENEDSNFVKGYRIKSGDSQIITVKVPADNVNKIDLDNPDIDFSGNFIEGIEIVPFGIVANLSVVADL